MTAIGVILILVMFSTLGLVFLSLLSFWNALELNDKKEWKLFSVFMTASLLMSILTYIIIRNI